MVAPAEHTLTPDSASALAGAVRFGRRFSREGMNRTPTPGVGTAPAILTGWPIKVTGAPITVDPVTTEESDSGDAVPLYPAVWLQPNEFATGYEDRDPVWLLPFSASCLLAPGSVVLARIAGYRLADGRVVYAGGHSPTCTPIDPSINCPPSVRLPCIGPGSGGGEEDEIPCWTITPEGVLYYDCIDLSPPTDPSGPPGGAADDGWMDGDLLAHCNGVSPVRVPGVLLVTAQDGTRSLLTAAGSQQTYRSGPRWPINISGDGYRIAGYLTYCCDAPTRGLYFVGTVSTSHNDPDEEDDASGEWCGCARQFTACPPCNQEIVSGPTFDPFAQTLRLDTGCGTIDLVIGPCVSIAGWQGPGYYCVDVCTELEGWQGPGYYCIEDAPTSGSGEEE